MQPSTFLVEYMYSVVMEWWSIFIGGGWSGNFNKILCNWLTIIVDKINSQQVHYITMALET